MYVFSHMCRLRRPSNYNLSPYHCIGVTNFVHLNFNKTKGHLNVSL